LAAFGICRDGRLFRIRVFLFLQCPIPLAQLQVSVEGHSLGVSQAVLEGLLAQLYIWDKDKVDALADWAVIPNRSLTLCIESHPQNSILELCGGAYMRVRLDVCIR